MHFIIEWLSQCAYNFTERLTVGEGVPRCLLYVKSPLVFIQQRIVIYDRSCANSSFCPLASDYCFRKSFWIVEYSNCM